MNVDTSEWLNREYNPLRAIADPAALFADWNDRSAAARAANPHHCGIAYGASRGETLDIFPASRREAPVLVFIHGGFWRGSDKAAHSFLAPAFTSSGACVVLLNYGLCPSVRIETIVEQVARGLSWVHRNIYWHGGDPRRIVLAGHSAGAHLAAMLLARDDGEIPPTAASRALCISGLFDLEAVRQVPYLQSDLGLTAESARMLSPITHRPRKGSTALAVVGEMESAAFHRQNDLLRLHWGTDAVPVSERIERRHHFDILEDLANPSTRLHALAQGLLNEA